MNDDNISPQENQNDQISEDNQEDDPLKEFDQIEQLEQENNENEKEYVEDTTINTITPAVIVRTIWLIVALTNYVLNLFGYQTIQFDNELVTELVNTLFLIVPALWCWWKNNSFTVQARISDVVLHDLKTDFSDAEAVSIDINEVE